MLRDLLALVRDIATDIRAVAQAFREERDRRQRAQSLALILSHPAADPVLDLDQAEAYSGGLTAKTLKSDALAGKLSVIRRSEGGHVRVRLSDLNTYLESQRRVARAASKSSTADEMDWGA